jgi:hypothetical protein
LRIRAEPASLQGPYAGRRRRIAQLICDPDHKKISLAMPN